MIFMKKLIIAGFIFSLAVLIGLGTLIYIEIIKPLNEFSDVERAREVIDPAILQAESSPHKISSSKFYKNSDTILQTGWYYVVDSNNGYRRQLNKDTIFYFIDPIPIVTVEKLDTLKIFKSINGYYGLLMKLNNEGTQAWSDATGKAIGRHLAFILDNKLMYVPRVESQITVGVTALNSTVYSQKELEVIKSTIEEEEKNNQK